MTDLYKIKPLQWQDASHGGYEEWTANTPFGSYTVSQYRWGYCFTEYHDEDEFSCESVEEGKAKAEANWRDRIAPIFEPLPEAPQWKPIETAPKDGAHILVCRFAGVIVDWAHEAWWVDERRGNSWQMRGGCCDPTHWTLLPAAPSLAQVEKADG